MVLDSKFEFQLKLQVLGEELVQIGTQLVFLTAILPLQDKEEFFRAMQILKESVYMFCSPISRRNIYY